MTSRERVALSYSHAEPDRVPLCIGGTAQKFSNRLYFQVKEKIGIQEQMAAEKNVDELGNVIHYHPGVLDFFHCDFRHVHINRLPPIKTFNDGSWMHELGFILQPNPENGLVSIVSHPLQEASLVDISSYHWPDPCDPRRIDGIREIASKYRTGSDFAIGLYKATLLGVFDLCCALRGMEQFLIDLMLSREIASVLLERCFDFTAGVYELLLQEAGDFVDVVEFNDDLGTQDNLIIPPGLYREFIKPYHAKIVSLIKKRARNAKVFLHCCGSIYDIIPDFIEIGVDILNPVQPNANKMETRGLKRDFGKKICFQGGIDLQRAMIGSTKDVEDEVRTRITTLGPGGGYVLSTANNIGGGVPLENVFALFENAFIQGRYPLTV
jgi:uroporphyrinogen decarboxylase